MSYAFGYPMSGLRIHAGLASETRTMIVAGGEVEVRLHARCGVEICDPQVGFPPTDEQSVSFWCRRCFTNLAWNYFAETLRHAEISDAELSRAMERVELSAKEARELRAAIAPRRVRAASERRTGGARKSRRGTPRERDLRQSRA